MTAVRALGGTTRRLLLASAAASLAPGPVAGPASSAPYLPASDDVVLERLPAADDARVREARRLAQDLARRPDDRELALEVARRYVDLGRSEGDPRFFGLAEGILTPWLAEPDPVPEVRLERAAIRRARHDFTGALADLDRVLEVRPDDVQARLDRATLLEGLGEYAAAERACLRVLRLYPSLVGVTCVASVRSLTGEAQPSLNALAAAIDATPADDPARGFALTVLGEIAARLGAFDAAERHFRAALDATPGDVYLLAVYADLLLDLDRPEQVLNLLGGQDRVDRLLLRRAIAARRLGDPRLADWQAELSGRFAAISARGGPAHLRDEARFTLEVLDQPGRALDLAGRNWSAQKGPADARLLLEAALAADAPAAAQPVLAWLETTQIEAVALERLRRALESLAS